MPPRDVTTEQNRDQLCYFNNATQAQVGRRKMCCWETTVWYIRMYRCVPGVNVRRGTLCYTAGRDTVDKDLIYNVLPQLVSLLLSLPQNLNSGLFVVYVLHLSLLLPPLLLHKNKIKIRQDLYKETKTHGQFPHKLTRPPTPTKCYSTYFSRAAATSWRPWGLVLFLSQITVLHRNTFLYKLG